MLCEWLKRVDLQPNWNSLVNALCAPAVGLGHLAEKVQRKYVSNVSKVLTNAADADIQQCIEKSHNSNRQTSISSVVAEFSFPYISEVASLDEGQKKALEQRLRDESQTIMLNFCTLLDRFLDSLEESSMTPKRLIRYLKKPLKVLDPDGDIHELETAANIEDIQNVIEENSSFIDFCLLEHMIKLAGTEENKEDLKKYKDDFECYAKRRIYECPANFGPSVTANHETLVVKRDATYNACKVSELQHFQAKLSQILQVPVHVLILQSVQKGCIRLAFLIPKFYLKDTFPLSIGQELAIADLGVILLTCGDYHYPRIHDQKKDGESDEDVSGSPPPTESELSAEVQPALIYAPMKRFDSIGEDSAIGTSIRTALASGGVSTCSEDTMELFINESGDIENISSETALLPISDNALFKASLRGNLDKVKQLIEKKGYNPLQFSSSQHTSLHYAARGGNVDILKYFIEEQGCMHSPEDHKKQIPLHVAARYGHFETVKYLVGEQMVDPTNLDSCNKTALDYATIKGHLAIVDFLIKEVAKYIPITALVQDKSLVSSYIPLHLAAQHGHVHLIEFFLTKIPGCDPNIRGKKKRHILHEAAKKGHTNVIRYLAQSQPSCNLSCLDKNKDTPLHIAAVNGKRDLVKLLAQDLKCETNHENKAGYTPLHLASLNGHLNVVGLLVSGLKCDPNRPTCFKKRTSLHLASLNGHLDVVKYLVHDRKCNQMTRDTDGVTPAKLALKNNHLEIVKYLNCSWINCIALEGDLESLHMFVSSQEYDLILLVYSGITPLHTALSKGHIGVAKYLVSNDICDPMSRDCDNNTALHIAAEQGQLSILKVFVFNFRCDPNVTGKYDYTPLHCAAVGGHLDIVKYLIERHNCDPSSRIDSNHFTPLHCASLFGNLDVVLYLTLEQGCDPMLRSRNQSSLDSAAFGGSVEIVKFFITVLDCNPCRQGSQVLEYSKGGIANRTPLHYAVETGHLSIVQYLINEHGCDPESTDSHQSTPLHLAAAQGHLNAVIYLTIDLKRNPHKVDQYSNTPIHDAARNGHLDVVKFLFEILDCKINSRGSCNMTPLQWALFKGHYHIVQYLQPIEKT